jgi:hypothetical protein
MGATFLGASPVRQACVLFAHGSHAVNVALSRDILATRLGQLTVRFTARAA